VNDIQFSGLFHRASHPLVDLWEARCPSVGAYSCVAVCKDGWDPDWPALGGTRWLHDPTLDFEGARNTALSEAARLSEAMMAKNRLLQRAERELQAKDPRWLGRKTTFGWQGGKGVILTTRAEDSLTPARLLCHGLLVDSLHGTYFASEDQGVGKGELRWIARSTLYNVGLGCAADTGDATSVGVMSAIYSGAIREEILRGPELGREELLSTECPPIFEGLTILVIGAGKVGLPLLGLLARRGAKCLVFDPDLNRLGVEGFLRRNVERGAAIDGFHADLLRTLAKERRMLPDERTALLTSEVDVISPNGGRTDWLRHAVEPSRSTTTVLAEGKAQSKGRLRLIAGAGNAQLIDDPNVRGDAEEILEPLERRDIQWIPDPIVSPGGVIAVSHEQKDDWVLDNVRADAFDIVRQNVAMVYEGAGRLDGQGALALYTAFQVRVQAVP
jgi:glutamate dehydrogenase/leucine dehydrogenase